MSKVDPTLCPICKEPNACAMEIARLTGSKAEHCWCFNALFSSDVLALVPDESKGRACVCQKCSSVID